MSERVLDSFTSLEGFQLEKVLSIDTKTKSVAVSGKFKGDSVHTAVIVAEKTPLLLTPASQLFSSSAELECHFSNDIYGQYEATSTDQGPLNITTIYPALDKHIEKYSDQGLFLVHEMYESLTKPFILNQALSVEWVYNILEGCCEADKVIFANPDPFVGFVLVPDLKWDGKEVENMYVLAIARRRGLRSLRDVTSEHVPLLKHILEEGKKSVESSYNIPGNQVKCYIHYQPSFYHLHVHITHVKHVAGGCMIGRAHLLDDVIDNLENIDGAYYQKRTMNYVLKESDRLLKEYINVNTAAN